MSNEENNALNQWSKYESSTRPINDPGANAYGDQQAEFNPRRTIMHKFFIFYSIIAGVSAFFLALGQFLGMAIEDLPDEVNEAVRYSLSLYLVVMCFLAVLTELEWFQFVTKSRVLTNWISRGLLYIFMALLSIDQSSLTATTNQRELDFIITVSYLFGAVGLGYSVMGLLCMQLWLKKMREEHEIRCKGGQLKKRDMIRNGGIVSDPLNVL